MFDNLLTERGHDTRLHVIIETNAGLEAAYDIAHCSPRIDAMFFGGVDMTAELRCRNEWEPLLYARSRVVPPMDFYEATEVKVRCTLCLEHVLSPLVCQIGGASCRVGTFLAWVARPCGCPTFIRAVSGADAPDPSPNPACCGHSVPEAGPFYGSASFSPVHGRPLTTRPSAGRVRPDWNSAVSGSGEPGACRHETGLTEPPESDEQLAGERYDHHTTDSSPASRGSVFEPFAKRAVWLMAQPAPRHLNELSPDPGWTVTADPLVALRVPARPRGWRYANPARELPAVAEPAIGNGGAKLVHGSGGIVSLRAEQNSAT